MGYIFIVEGSFGENKFLFLSTSFIYMAVLFLLILKEIQPLIKNSKWVQSFWVAYEVHGCYLVVFENRTRQSLWELQPIRSVGFLR